MESSDILSVGIACIHSVAVVADVAVDVAVAVRVRFCVHDFVDIRYRYFWLGSSVIRRCWLQTRFGHLSALFLLLHIFYQIGLGVAFCVNLS